MVRRFASAAVLRSQPPGGHSSNAMTTSAPRVRWISMTDSGVNMCSEPSMWLWKRTPSSSIRRISASEKTWKPPESVRIGPSQRMKSWRPPSCRTSSCPGRRYRWYVLASTISAPRSRTSDMLTLFTVPSVPTGMKAGVWRGPWGVLKVPARAAPSVAFSV
jgi:hypothetical protein